MSLKKHILANSKKKTDKIKVSMLGIGMVSYVNSKSC